MTDRLCIQSEGEVKFQFSPQDILSCCENCSNSTYGCAVGGSSDRAWRYWTESGIVSGGDYDSYQVSNEGTKHSCWSFYSFF
jgi:cathepsin B